jgi:hypothetical protein
MRRVAYWNVQREVRRLKVPYGIICENYLGAPLIKAGDSVIIN